MPPVRASRRSSRPPDADASGATACPARAPGASPSPRARAAGLALAAGLPRAAVEAGLAACAGAPGRLERIEANGVAAFVDYAHTDDALARALAALRALAPRRLVVVFGCGGDRDRGKRPLMGEAAARGADLAVVTSDNPRSEDPDAIIAGILPGLARTGARRL